ncbi:MAG: family 16 glycosylhydrolase [Candidatus Fimenecus sp.]
MRIKENREKGKKLKMTLGIITAVILVIAVAVTATVLVIKDKNKYKVDESWRDAGYDLSLPVLGQDGWYMVFEDDFEGTALNQNIKFGERYNGSREIWTTSPHAIRWESNDEAKPEQACWWCPNMVEVRNGTVIIHSRYEENHTCDGNCPAEGRFTSGIETRKVVGDSNNNKGSADELLFAQAFGYFEAKVKFPDTDGLWSAFWLQSSNMRKIASEGVDGTEIDIYESAFRRNKISRMGHALLWNGYGKYGKVDDHILNLEQNLYDGEFHTFALKWTPEYYVFYIDGEPTWATMGGGVSKVKEFLRLTVEIDAGDGWGPHGQKIGQFDHSSDSEFVIDYVKVWQNEIYSQYEIEDDKFPGALDFDN